MDEICILCKAKQTYKPLVRGLCGLCYMHHWKRKTLDTVALPRRKTPPLRRPDERWMDKNGYIQVRVNGSSRAEHRIVMEEMIGRPLVRGENVHHINGVRDDNRPKNLELWFSPQPYGQRVQELIDYIAEHHNEAMRKRLDAP